MLRRDRSSCPDSPRMEALSGNVNFAANTGNELDGESKVEGEAVDDFYEECDRLSNKLARIGIQEPNLHQQTFKKDSRVWLHKNRRAGESRGQSQRGEKTFPSIPEQDDVSHEFVYSVMDGKGRRFKKDSRSWLHKTSDRRRPRLERDERAASDPVDISKAAMQMEGKGTNRKLVHSDSMMMRFSLPAGNSKTRSSLHDVTHPPEKPLAVSKSLDSILVPTGKTDGKTFHLVSSTTKQEAYAKDRSKGLGLDKALLRRCSSDELRMAMAYGSPCQASGLSGFPGASEPGGRQRALGSRGLHPSASRTSITTQHGLQLVSSDESGPAQPSAEPEVGLRRSAALMPRQRGGYCAQTPGSGTSSCGESTAQERGTSLSSVPSPPDFGQLDMAGGNCTLNICSRSSERNLNGESPENSSSAVDISLIEHLI